MDFRCRLGPDEPDAQVIEDGSDEWLASWQASFLVRALQVLFTETSQPQVLRTGNPILSSREQTDSD